MEAFCIWTGALIAAVNVIPSPKRTEAPTFSSTIPDCAQACCVLNRPDTPIIMKTIRALTDLMTTFLRVRSMALR